MDSLLSLFPSLLMNISKEDELADLFGDVLRIAGSPEAGRFFAVILTYAHRSQRRAP